MSFEELRAVKVGRVFARYEILEVKDQFKAAYCNGQWSTNTGRYTISVGYSWLQGDQAKVPWHPVIWNRLNLPKHSFIGWLAIQGRLITKDRVLRFGVIQDSTYDMCMDQTEDHSYMLYQCRFSSQCWTLLADWLGVVLPSTGILEWRCSWRCRSLMKKKIVIAAILAMIYQLWLARNLCRVECQFPLPAYIFKSVQSIVQSRGQNWK
ncbi:uncharacterized protein LOC141607817 [Silene latifolia]|uniref:uncharacterized protein LOC141607817 n=1 Tax=Silene latifolia TaxID=37657 RepID=UPI003D775076